MLLLLRQVLIWKAEPSGGSSQEAADEALDKRLGRCGGLKLSVICLVH